MFVESDLCCRMNYRNIMFRYFRSRKDSMVHSYSRSNVSKCFKITRARCESGSGLRWIRDGTKRRVRHERGLNSGGWLYPRAIIKYIINFRRDVKYRGKRAIILIIAYRLLIIAQNSTHYVSFDIGLGADKKISSRMNARWGNVDSSAAFGGPRHDVFLFLSSMPLEPSRASVGTPMGSAVCFREVFWVAKVIADSRECTMALIAQSDEESSRGRPTSKCAQYVGVLVGEFCGWAFNPFAYPRDIETAAAFTVESISRETRRCQVHANFAWNGAETFYLRVPLGWTKLTLSCFSGDSSVLIRL